VRSENVLDIRFIHRQIVKVALADLRLLLKVTEPIFFHPKDPARPTLPANVVAQLEAAGTALPLFLFSTFLISPGEGSIVFVLEDTPSDSDSPLERAR